MAELTTYSHSLIEGLQARVANLKLSRKMAKMGSMVSSYLCVLHVQVMICSTGSVNKFIFHLFVNCYFTIEWKIDMDCDTCCLFPVSVNLEVSNEVEVTPGVLIRAVRAAPVGPCYTNYVGSSCWSYKIIG